MGKAHLRFSLKGQGVGGAVIKVGSILPPVLFALAPVVIRLGSAVSAEHETGQGIGDAGGICPAYRPLHLLGQLPGFRVNNGLVGVLKNQPVGRVIFYPLIPIGLLGRTDSVVSKMETTAADGKRYQTNYYNLDAIIAVGYRVNSKKATMFRIWANRVLKEFIIKGYVMDDARLREPENFFGKDYFEEQLERIRDIRASERRFYQKITDIYSQCSADYDVESPITKEFFATVQNKLHYAVTHHTAAEIVYGRADSTKPNMGLTTWKNAPKGRIRKSDVTVAKNYLNETEMRNLNEIVTMYLDYAERQARRGNVMYMADWVKRLDAFLQFNEEDILHDKGKVTAAIAKVFAEKEFEKFQVLQDRTYQSDFDRLIAETSDDLTD